MGSKIHRSSVGKSLKGLELRYSGRIVALQNPWYRPPSVPPRTRSPFSYAFPLTFALVVIASLGLSSPFSTAFAVVESEDESIPPLTICTGEYAEVSALQ